MKKNEKTAIGVIIVVALVIAYFGGFLTQFGLPPPAFQAGGPTQVQISDQDKENYAKGIGRWNVYETVSDSLDPAVTRTSATNYKLYWYTRQGTTWIYHETGNNKYVSLTPADTGYLWVVVTIPSAQAFYVDYPKIVSTNQYIDQYMYTDVDGDGVKEFAFRYDMKGHAIPNSGYPSITFLGFILTYEASFPGITHWNSTSLGNSTSIGTTTVSKFYSYYFTFATAKSAIGIYKVEFKINGTDITKARLKKFNVPSLGFIDGSLFTQTITGTDILWTYEITRSFDGALYVKYPANSNNRFDLTEEVEWTLGATDHITCTTTIYYLVAQTEAGASATHTFYAKAFAGS